MAPEEAGNRDELNIRAGGEEETGMRREFARFFQKFSLSYLRGARGTRRTEDWIVYPSVS